MKPLKTPSALAIPLFLLATLCAPQLHAQTNPQANYFSTYMEFTRTEINLGYYGWGNVWLAKEPYNVFFRSRLEGLALNPQYYVELSVYMGHTDFSRCLFHPELCGKNGGKNTTKVFKMADATAPELLGAKDGRDEIDWRNDTIYMLIERYKDDIIITKEEQRVAELPLPTHKVNFDGEKLRLYEYEGQYSGGQDFLIDGLAWSVAESEDLNHPGEYITVASHYQGVGNLSVRTLEASVYSPSTPEKPIVEMTYNLVTAIPGVNSYAVIMKDQNAFCLWDYDLDAYNSVYYAVKEGGVDAGFEQFKKTVMYYDYNKPQPKKKRCLDNDNSIIGFVNLTPPGGWQGWKINEPYTVTLGREGDGWPWVVDKTTGTTIAAGGNFSFSEFVISNDPNALQTLPTGVFPGAFCISGITIPAGYDPGPPPCAAVTNAKAEIALDCQSATISWAAAEKYAEEYWISRTGKPTVKVAGDVHSVEINGVFKNGETYEWEIKTICAAGIESDAVTVTATATCETGINELADPVAIYPNPATGMITIEVAGFSKVEIYNPIGQWIETKTVNTFDVSSYNTGIYFFKVFDSNNNSVTKRVMVAKY